MDLVWFSICVFFFGGENLILVYIWLRPHCRLSPQFLQSPLRRARDWWSPSGPLYSGLAPFARLAFVTLMHWSDNISGMVIPRFSPCCGITSYCLSCRVFQLVHSRGRRAAWFPCRTTVGSGWISIQKAKSPLWWELARFLLQEIDFIFPQRSITKLPVTLRCCQCTSTSTPTNALWVITWGGHLWETQWRSTQMSEDWKEGHISKPALRLKGS